MDGGTVDVPKVGRVKKVYLWAGIGGVALFVGWRYYQAAKAPAEGAPPATGDVGAPVDASGVVGTGGGPGNIQYAGTTTDTRAEPGPGNFTSNAEWTQYAVTKLSEAGFDPVKVYQALGDFLARRPVDTAEQQIITAAIAAAGQPPVGGPYSIVPQVGTITLAAPTGLKATTVGRTSVTFTFNPVPGATFYYLFQTGLHENVGASRDTRITASNLRPATRYTFAVAAATATGKVGPHSSTVTITTSK